MTERNYNPKQKEKKAMKNQEKAVKKTNLEIKKDEIKSEKKEIVEEKIKEEIIKDIEKGGVSESIAKQEEKIAEKTEEKLEKETEKSKDKKTKKTEKIKIKKTEALVDIKNLPISTLHSIAICKFIKGKKIDFVIKDLENVARIKKPVPMKGEIPHRKGKIMSGRFPKKASEHFIKVLKSLQANSNANGLNEPIIVEAISNIAHRPYGKFGRVRRKRTHLKIKAKEMGKNKEKK